MIYNTIDKDLVGLGEPKPVFNKGNFLTAVYYEGGRLEFAEKNKYIEINCIETTKYNKDQIIVKSKTLAKIVEDIVTTINAKISKKITSPVQADGSFRVNVTKDSKFIDKNQISISVADMKNLRFTACISVYVPTIFTDSNKSTLQLNLSDCVVIEKKGSGLEIDFDKLTLAD